MRTALPGRRFFGRKFFGRRLLGLGAAGVFAAASLAAVAPSASAANNVLCDAAGNIYVTHPAANKIGLKVSGIGRCLGGDDKGPYIMTLSGTGTAATLGACDDKLTPLITNLSIPVHLHLQSVVHSWYSVNYDVNFQLLVSTFPRIGEFTIMKNGAPWGAGAFLTAQKTCEGDQDSSGMLVDFDFVNNLL